MDGIYRAAKVTLLKRMTRSSLPRILGQFLRAAAPLTPLLLAVSCDNPTSTKPSYDFQVDPENIRSLIAEISVRHRRVFTDDNRQTVDYLENKLREYLGPETDVSRQPVDISGLRDTFAEMFPLDTIDDPYNVIARIPGRDPSRKIIFTAHLDSRGEGFYSEVAPGANDNATGLAVLLEIARNLAGHDFPFSIELVAFNAEEMSRLGSAEYVRSLVEGDRSILAVINLDTLGGNLIADRLVITYDGLSIKLAEQIAAVNSEDSIVPLLEAKESGCASDECSFRENKIPAVMISENTGPAAELLYPGNVLFHTSGDTPDRLNPNLVAKAAELCLKYIESMAVSGDWAKLIRPAITDHVEEPFAFLVDIGEGSFFLTIHNEDATGLKYGILYDRQGNPLYRLELSYHDENLGLIKQLDDGSVVGRVSLPADPASGRVIEPLTLEGRTVLNSGGAVIGRVRVNTGSSMPADSTFPPIEIFEPGTEVLTLLNQGVLLSGRTEPGLAVFPSIMTENIEAGPDGRFATTLPIPFSLEGAVAVDVRDELGNLTRIDLNYNLPTNETALFGANYKFYGDARRLADDPNYLSAIARTEQIPGIAAVNYAIFIDPASNLDFKGTTTPEQIRISLRTDSLPDNLRKVYASITIHEAIHATNLTVPGWAALYEQGKTLGAWEIIDDSVFLNYISDAGHPKESPEEGLASAGQAYILFPETFRRIIEVLSLPEMPVAPFEQESMNRVVRLIWESTPDRAALRQNLLDIYNSFRDNCFSGLEFETDI